MNKFFEPSVEDVTSYNAAVSHPLQSYEWGDFRTKTGIKVIRRILKADNKIKEAFTLTIHPIPHTSFNIGYLPKGNIPSPDVLEELISIGKENNCIFIQIEPNIRKAEVSSSQLTNQISNLGLRPSHHPLFTKYTFVLDLKKSEEELLATMHPKTRYNIRVAQKHGVVVIENNNDDAFKQYLRLGEQTTKRQKFYAHSNDYHQIQWQTLPHSMAHNQLSSHLLTATYNSQILASWILFAFIDPLYYPYGASSTKYREVMASNLIMWEAIRFGKKLGLSFFDMWGALEKEPNKSDAWYGFHRFKEGYGAAHTEFIGSFDLVIKPAIYQLYKAADIIRWGMLSLKNKVIK